MNHIPSPASAAAPLPQASAPANHPGRAAAAAKVAQLADWAMELAARAHRRAIEADDAGDAKAADEQTARVTRLARAIPRLLAYQEHFEKPAHT
jgi:hypothetical protein